MIHAKSMHSANAAQSNASAGDIPQPSIHIHAQPPPIMTGVAAPARVFGLAASTHAFTEFVFTSLFMFYTPSTMSASILSFRLISRAT